MSAVWQIEGVRQKVSEKMPVVDIKLVTAVIATKVRNMSAFDTYVRRKVSAQYMLGCNH